MLFPTVVVSPRNYLPQNQFCMMRVGRTTIFIFLTKIIVVTSFSHPTGVACATPWSFEKTSYIGGGDVWTGLWY